VTQAEALGPTPSSPENPRHHEGPPPSPWLLALEFRAAWEFGALLPAWPLLLRAPMGDGHPVIVFPGLSASDGSTAPLRNYLATRNYDVTGWNQGHNFGPRAGVLEAASHQVREIFIAAGKRKVSLIGWSLGGIYAREMAKLHPQIQRLLAGESVPDVEDFSSPRPDGSREYPLIVRMGDPSELDAIGLRAQSRVGEAVTVRATLKEIESLARLSSVVSIEPGSRNEPTNKID